MADVQTEDVVIVKINKYYTQGPNWKSFNGEAFEPSIVMETRKMGSAVGSPTEKVKIKHIGEGGKNFWMRDVVKEGQTFSMAISRGEYEGHPWASVNDIPFFYDAKGQPQRLKRGGEIPTNENTPITEKPIIPKPSVNSAGEKIPPGATKFLDLALFVPQSDAWWEVKNRMNIDGALISNAFHYAAIICANGKEPNRENILDYAAWFESEMRQMQQARLQARLTMMLGLSTKKEHVIEIVNQAWARLPKSHYNILRGIAKDRLDEIGKNPAPLDVTPQPEAPEVPEENFQTTAMDETTAADATPTEEDIPF